MQPAFCGERTNEARAMANQRWMRNPIRHGDISRDGLQQRGTRHGRERRRAGADCRHESTVADVFTPPYRRQRPGLQCQQKCIGQAINFALLLDSSGGHTAVAELRGNLSRRDPAHHCLSVFLGRSVLSARFSRESWELSLFRSPTARQESTDAINQRLASKG